MLNKSIASPFMYNVAHSDDIISKHFNGTATETATSPELPILTKVPVSASAPVPFSVPSFDDKYDRLEASLKKYIDESLMRYAVILAILMIYISINALIIFALTN